MKKKVLALILGALMAASAITGCGGGGGSAAAPSSESGSGATASSRQMVEGGEFVKGVSTEVSNFDPFIAQTADARSIFFNIYEGLLNTESDGSFVPALAESYESSEDLKTWTFKLRGGVKFHNGSEVTMDDVLFSIKSAIAGQITGFGEIESYMAKGTLFTPVLKENEEKKMVLDEVKETPSEEAPEDDVTLVIRLNVADSGFAAVITSPIVPAGSTDLATKPVGTGPFKLEEFVEQDYTLLTRFDDYWGEPAHLDSVRLKYFENTSELATNFLTGAIDGFNSNAGGWMELEGTDYVKNIRHSNAVQLLALNNDFAPFRDVRVRQAIAYAVDSQDVINTVSYGLGTKCGTPVIPGLAKYFNDELTDVYDVNIEKAKELLKEAGQEGLTFTIRPPSNYQQHMDTAQVIVNQLAKAGITVEIEAVDWGTWFEKVYSGREYEATIVSVDGPTAFPTSFLSRYVSTASNNFVNFKSDEFDEVYEKATLCADDEEQVKLFKEAQKILSDECASVYIQDFDNVIVYSPSFEGFKAYPLYVDDYSVMYKVQ